MPRNRSEKEPKWDEFTAFLNSPHFVKTMANLELQLKERRLRGAMRAPDLHEGAVGEKDKLSGVLKGEV